MINYLKGLGIYDDLTDLELRSRLCLQRHFLWIIIPYIVNNKNLRRRFNSTAKKQTLSKFQTFILWSSLYSMITTVKK